MINSSWKLVIRIFRTVAKGIRIFLFRSRSKKSWNESVFLRCLILAPQLFQFIKSCLETKRLYFQCTILLVQCISAYSYNAKFFSGQTNTASSPCSVRQLGQHSNFFTFDFTVRGITIFTDNSRWLEAKHIITMRYFWYYTGFVFSTITENVGFILQRLKADSAPAAMFF